MVDRVRSKAGPHGIIFAGFAALLLSVLTIFGAEIQPLDGALQKAAEYERTENFPAALKTYRAAASENPESAEAWAAYGEHLRFYAHDFDAAENAFKQALNAKQQNAHAMAYAWRGLGEIEIKRQHPDKAIEDFKRSLEADALPDTHRSLCHLYCVQRNFKAAAVQARFAVELAPDDAIARLLYAAQLHRAGDVAQGRTEFLRALAPSGLTPAGDAAAPVHCCIVYNAAGYLSVAGDKPGALKMLKRFFETPNHRHLERAEIEADADFETLKELPEFRVLLDTYLSENSAEKKSTEPNATENPR